MPQTGWDQEPDPGDTTEIADSIRLRLARNRIQHGRLELTRQEYRALYRLVEQPLGRIGCPPNDLKQLTPSFKYNIPDATPNFIGSCLLYTSPSPRDGLLSRMPSSA